MNDFDQWNEIKKKTDKEIPRFYKVREIWWCRFGLNIGTEQNGKGKSFLRPVLIIRGFGKYSCLVIPLTTSYRNHYFRINIGIIEGREVKANISQIKTIDVRRLVEKIITIDVKKFTQIRKTVKDLL